MLRAAVIVLGGVLLAGGLVALWAGEVPSGLGAALFGLLLIVGTLYEAARYKPVEPQPPGPGWEPTGERFIDDATGRPVTVFVERRSGERKYVDG